MSRKRFVALFMVFAMLFTLMAPAYAVAEGEQLYKLTFNVEPANAKVSLPTLRPHLLLRHPRQR